MSEEELLKKAVREGLAKSWKRESLDHWRKVGQYYPSGIGSCLRKQYYDFVSPKPPTPEELAIFATGKGIHEAVAEALQKSGLVHVDKVEMPVSLNLSQEVSLTGRVDILLAQVGGRKVIVEVKSTSHLPDQPHENHVMQLQTYLHALNLELGILLYWDKRTGEIGTFRVPRDLSWMNKIGERTFMLDAHLRTKKVPFREAFATGRYWECDFCPYLAECDPFTFEGVMPGSRLAMMGVEAEVQGDQKTYRLKPDLISIKKTVFTLKSEGQIVVLLCDFPPGLGSMIKDEFKAAGVNFDVIIVKPVEQQSARVWKVELTKRLLTKYQVARFVDPDDQTLNQVAKFSRSIQKI